MTMVGFVNRVADKISERVVKHQCTRVGFIRKKKVNPVPCHLRYNRLRARLVSQIIGLQTRRTRYPSPRPDGLGRTDGGYPNGSVCFQSPLRILVAAVAVAMSSRLRHWSNPLHCLRDKRGRDDVIQRNLDSVTSISFKPLAHSWFEGTPSVNLPLPDCCSEKLGKKRSHDEYSRRALDDQTISPGASD